MADERPFSVTKAMAALGGALLLASFFLPLISADGRDDVRREMFGVQSLRQQMEASRELQAVQPLLEPALQDIERFTETPSLRNLSSLAATSRELLDTAAGFGVPEAGEMRQMSEVLGLVRMCLWTLPLVGGVQLAAPLVTLLRGYAGFLGLVGRFLFGTVFLLVAFVPLAGVPDAQRPYIGSAVWALLFGSLLMMVASVFGVTRRNWWMVLLADLGILVGVGAALVWVSEMVR